MRKSTLLKMLRDKLLKNGVPTDNLPYIKLNPYDVPLEPSIPWLGEPLFSPLENVARSSFLRIS